MVFVTYYPGPTPKYCSRCKPVVAREQTAERVRAWRARKRLEGKVSERREDGVKDLQKDPEVVWIKVVEELRRRTSREISARWLRPMRLIAHVGDTYVVSVPSLHAREWLENKLGDLVQETVKRIGGSGVEVSFVVVKK